MPTNCKIIFDSNEERVYYGGQMIEGRVRLTLAKEKIVRGNYPLFTTSDSICYFSFFFIGFFVASKCCDKNGTNLSVLLLFILQLTIQFCCFKMMRPMYRVIYAK